MLTRIINLWIKLRSNLWFIPALTVLSVMTMAFYTLYLDKYTDFVFTFKEHKIFEISPQGARSLLSTIAGSVIGIAGVSFSVTIVVLSLASSQFGPRLLNNFMKDWVNKIILGIFIATFVYCLLVLGSVSEYEGQA